MAAVPDGTGQTTATRGRRDPGARRQAIVRAASDLLVEGGGDLTHRRVAERADVPLGATTYYFSSLDELREAGLELLATELDEALAEMRQEAAESSGDPEVLASLLHDYLSDQNQVRADAALYGAAIQRPELRALALRWFDGVVELLSDWADPATAQLLAVFADGACLHATFHGQPLDRAAIARAMTALMGPAKDER